MRHNKPCSEALGPGWARRKGPCQRQEAIKPHSVPRGLLTPRNLRGCAWGRGRPGGGHGGISPTRAPPASPRGAPCEAVGAVGTAGPVPAAPPSASRCAPRGRPRRAAPPRSLAEPDAGAVGRGRPEALGPLRAAPSSAEASAVEARPWGGLSWDALGTPRPRRRGPGSPARGARPRGRRASARCCRRGRGRARRRHQPFCLPRPLPGEGAVGQAWPPSLPGRGALRPAAPRCLPRPPARSPGPRPRGRPTGGPGAPPLFGGPPPGSRPSTSSDAASGPSRALRASLRPLRAPRDEQRPRGLRRAPRRPHGPQSAADVGLPPHPRPPLRPFRCAPRAGTAGPPSAPHLQPPGLAFPRHRPDVTPAAPRPCLPEPAAPTAPGLPSLPLAPRPVPPRPRGAAAAAPV